ncbi:5591_t:CDS:2 [Acaulospora morrowiae]|uniref:5591_t:CDS:1 n=1 Tax=Acaulospora morrowiae TaxID=94023 RepID=A0A9N9IA19_9GLOM|nr:5591_t:CDS:2 [Acaulospora morrowiae]
MRDNQKNYKENLDGMVWFVLTRVLMCLREDRLIDSTVKLFHKLLFFFSIFVFVMMVVDGAMPKSLEYEIFELDTNHSDKSIYTYLSAYGSVWILNQVATRSVRRCTLHSFLWCLRKCIYSQIQNSFSPVNFSASTEHPSPWVILPDTFSISSPSVLPSGMRL